jgi:mono/diheme cytochrome c family protein
MKANAGFSCYLVVIAGLLQALEAKAQGNAAMLPAAAQINVDFPRDIEPILRERCQSCHGPKLQSGGFRLDTRAGALAGGYSGPVIKPGASAESKLIRLVAGLEKALVMPLAGPRLTPEQVGLLRAWIDQGARWREQAGAVSEKIHSRSTHWAFIPPKRPAVPEPKDMSWVRNAIDAFVLARLESEGIRPSPEANRVTLIRRLSLDMIGLPPTPEEVKQFIQDTRPDAYEHLVDRLLASPHYGEKWARYWLDQARYGDSDGFETDAPRPFAWRYRHWVINVLNRNMPFDQFTIEQLAGDLLLEAGIEQKVATGFNRNTLTNREGGMDLDMLRLEQVMDRANTLGTVWLALTVGCAQCHDHKYDPISQKEYYQLFAFFNSAIEVNVEAPLKGELGPYLHGKLERDRKRRALLAEYKVPELQPEWEKKTLEAATNPKVGDHWILAWETVGYDFDGGQSILRLEASRRTQKQQDQLTDHFIKWYGLVLPPGKYKELKFDEVREKLEKLDEEYPPLSEAPALMENLHPPESHILTRGDYRQPGIVVQPGTPSVLPPLPSGSKPTRLTLAQWLVSKDNPLTARVAVNRMWQEFFGRGLVETSENFGTRGDKPSHPELLDWLATEFMDNRWDVKKMHKLIVESATYRQTSTTRKDLTERDPNNKLLASQSRVRLPAELVRDSALAVSGILNPAIGGKSFFPPQPASVGELAYRNHWRETKGPERYRRGLYIFRKRTMQYPQLAAFDIPDSLTACTRRERSTTPLQALNLLNDPVFFEAAQGLATRIIREMPGAVDGRVDYAFRLSIARDPSKREKDRLLRYYEQQKELMLRDPETAEKLYPANGIEGVDRTEAAAWVSVSTVLLNLDEFITRN